MYFFERLLFLSYLSKGLHLIQCEGANTLLIEMRLNPDFDLHVPKLRTN